MLVRWKPRHLQQQRRSCYNRLALVIVVSAVCSVIVQIVSYGKVNIAGREADGSMGRLRLAGAAALNAEEAGPGIAPVIQDIALGMASKITLPELTIFIKSFRQRAPAARLALFIDKETPGTHLELLNKYDVEAIRFSIDDDLPDLIKSFHPSNYRWILLRKFLQRQSLSPMSRVLLADIRDTTFQRNPFDIVPGNQTGLWISLEAGGPIISCGWNRGWVQDCFGEAILNQVGARKISCSGITIGRADAIQEYLDSMATELESRASCERNGVDQGVHNVLVWTNRLPNVHFIEINDGRVAHIQAMNEHDITIRDDLVLASYSPDLVPFAVVHQYDRRPDLIELFRRLYFNSA